LAVKIGHELAAESATLPADRDRISAAIDVLWARYSTPLFNAWLELWTAARTDAELRAALVPVERRLRRAIDRQARALFADAGDATGKSGETTPLHDEMLAMTFCLFQGMALERTMTGNGAGRRPTREAALLSAWKQILADRLYAPLP
jgi:hypothetical protein